MALSATQVASLFVAIGANLDGLNRGLGEAESKLKATGSKMVGIGKGMTRNVTLPLVGIGTAALAMGIQYESAFAGVVKTTEGVRDEFGKLTELGEELRQGFRDMAMEIPTSAEELAAIGEAAGQLGIEAENILDFTRVMADLGETTNLSSEEAAMALAQMANVTGMAQTDFDRLGSSIVALGNNFATTEQDIVNMASRLAAAGTIIGMSEDEILAYAATLSSVGINAEAGGSAISRVFMDIANSVAQGGDGLEQFAAVAGMSTEEFARAFQEDAAGAVSAFIQGLHAIDESGGNVFQTLEDLGFSNIRVRETLLKAANAGSLLDDALSLSATAWQENTALTDEAGIRYETTASQLQILLNTLKEVGMEFADVMLPVLNELLPYLRDAVKWFGNLPEPVKKGIVVVAGLAAVLGPLFVIIGSIISVVSTVAGVFGTLVPALGGAAAAAVAFLGPVGLVIAALVALGVILALNWDEVSEWAKKTWATVTEWANNTVTTIEQWASGFVQGISDWSTNTQASLDEWAANTSASITNWANNVAASIEQWGANTSASVQTWRSQTGNAINEWAAQTGARIGQWVTTIAEAFYRIRNTIQNLVSQMIQLGKNLIQGLIDGAKQMAQRLIDAIVGPIKNAIAAAKRLLGIGSPSKLFRGIGLDVMGGMQDGLKAGAKDVAATLKAVLPIPSPISAAILPPLPTLHPAPPLPIPGGGGRFGQVGSGGVHIVNINIKEPITISDPRQIDQMADAIAKRLNLRGGYRTAYRRASA